MGRKVQHRRPQPQVAVSFALLLSYLAEAYAFLLPLSMTSSCRHHLKCVCMHGGGGDDGARPGGLVAEWVTHFISVASLTGLAILPSSLPLPARGAVTLDFFRRSDAAVAATLPRQQQQQHIDYGCLMSKCGKELSAALLDPRGMDELTCLTACGENDLSCQLRCGDRHKEEVLDTFNTCAISQHQCIPQRVEPGPALEPAPEVLVQSLALEDLSGEWYITHGVSSLFDCFPCQHHQVKGEPRAMSIDVTYQVPTGAFERSFQQRFQQDRRYPGVLHSYDESRLRQEDDWFILAADPKNYMMVVYTGCNAAWCGYTGGVVYSRTPELDPAAIPTIREAAQKAGLSFDKFCTVDNSCAARSGLGGQGPPCGTGVAATTSLPTTTVLTSEQ